MHRPSATWMQRKMQRPPTRMACWTRSSTEVEAMLSAQDAQTVVVRDAGSIDAFAVPDQAVLPPDAQMVADAPVSVTPGPDAPVRRNNNPLALMGSGFCAVNPMRDSAPGLFTFFLLAGFGLVLRRRRR